MENNFSTLLADVIDAITPEELASCQINVNNPQHAHRGHERRTMIAYENS